MNWKEVVNLGAVVLVLGPSMMATAQEPPAPPAAPAEAGTSSPPATMTLPGLASTTQRVTCEVVQVDGTYLIVKLESGELRVFNVDPARRFIVDGKPLTVHKLK